jgi:translation initiation factor IF-3
LNRYNRQITDTHVLVIDETGANLGKMVTLEALQLARSKELDLVEVAEGVCKIQDYQKFLYQQKKASKGNKKAPDVKEFQFGINIAVHDIQVKANKINELLEKGHPIRIVVRFFGREKAHMEKGLVLIERLAEFIPNTVMDPPKTEGSQITTMVRKAK